MLGLLRKLWLTFVDEYLEMIGLPLIHYGIIPDFLIRFGMRREMAAQKLHLEVGGLEEQANVQREFIAQLKTMPIAINQPEANDQHYEVPTEFYQACLGPFFKYSSGYWPNKNTTFEESEVAMLEMYCQRAGLEDGMKIMDLGCGWGSVTLFVAQKYPKATVVSLSNSSTQREYIMSTAKARGLSNITVFTGDINEWDHGPEHKGSFDRVISIEMFEHMKNYQKLLGKVSTWLQSGGKLFIHIFTHKAAPYHFDKGWMAQTFFTGGTMPSDSLLIYFQDDLKIEGHWRVPGTHYQKTSEAWLKNLDDNKKKLWPVLTKTYGAGNEMKWFVNWRLFYLACAELFGYADGSEWIVSHYLFVKP